MYKFNIKEIRISKNLTQKKLARKAKISQSYLSKIENNKTLLGVNINIIHRLAKALNCTGADLITWSK